MCRLDCLSHTFPTLVSSSVPSFTVLIFDKISTYFNLIENDFDWQTFKFHWISSWMSKTFIPLKLYQTYFFSKLINICTEERYCVVASYTRSIISAKVFLINLLNKLTNNEHMRSLSYSHKSPFKNCLPWKLMSFHIIKWIFALCVCTKVVRLCETWVLEWEMCHKPSPLGTQMILISSCKVMKNMTRAKKW